MRGLSGNSDDSGDLAPARQRHRRAGRGRRRVRLRFRGSTRGPGDLPAGDGGLSAQKREHYLASLAMLERRLPGHPLVRQLRFELETLEFLPPRRG